jgi:hypothetical protein
LEGLDTDIDVGAVRDPLMMHDHGKRRVVHPLAVRAYFESEVGILVVGGGVIIIETPQLLEQSPRHEQRGTGAIVDLTDEVEFGRVWILQPAVIPTRSIVPHDAAGLLQPSVRID